MDTPQTKFAAMLLHSKMRDYRRVYNLFYQERIKSRAGDPYGSPLFKKLCKFFFFIPNYKYMRYYFYFFKTIGVGSNLKILDIGCGDGLLSIALARKKNSVIGIDVSDVSIELANKNKRIFNCQNVKFRQMDCRRLLFPNNYFDLAVSFDLIEHLHPDDLSLHLDEVYRILKKDSFYLISTPNKIFYLSGGLHLKTYTHSSIEKILSQKFLVKSPVFNWNPFFMNNQSLFHLKKIIEKFVVKFKILRALSSPFVNPVIVNVYKK